jgi:hypothetical protein
LTQPHRRQLNAPPVPHPPSTPQQLAHHARELQSFAATRAATAAHHRADADAAERAARAAAEEAALRAANCAAAEPGLTQTEQALAAELEQLGEALPPAEPEEAGEGGRPEGGAHQLLRLQYGAQQPQPQPQLAQPLQLGAQVFGRGPAADSRAPFGCGR